MSQDLVKLPVECAVMDDVRLGIDSIDEQLLDLLAQRIAYIERAARIKLSLDSIRDEQRIQTILDKRKSQAIEHGYQSEFIEHFFRELIEYSIAHETRVWKKINQT